MGSKLIISPSSFNHLYIYIQVSVDGAVEIMPDNFPVGIIVLGGSCPSNRGDFPV